MRPILSATILLLTLASGATAVQAAAMRHVAARALIERAEGLYSGTSGELHPAEAKRLFLKAAETGDAVARLRVATLQALGWCRFQKDEARADELAAPVLADVEELAERGDAYARFLVGLSYLSGIGTEPDPGKARPLLERSAAAGEVWALWGLGWTFEKGLGVEADQVVAMDWYERAADAGHAYSMTAIGDAYLGAQAGRTIDYPKAKAWFERAAERGQPGAMTRLGEMHDRGHYFEKSRRAAIDWYLRAASLGEGLAMYHLAHAAFLGNGLPRDSAAGMGWLRQSAEADFYYAVFEMGKHYDEGLKERGEWVVYPDLAEATRWFQRSAELGSLEARGWLEFQRIEGRIR